jgi:hypothetical protein
MSVPDADILHGCRAAADLPAPGRPLGGWCGLDSNSVLGQWLSGMTRLAKATGDKALADKARGLFAEWSKTVKPDGDARMKHYAFDKLVGGLVDLQQHGGIGEAGPMLARVTAFADKTFDRAKLALADPTHNQHYYGLPQEWYTLAENLYRAYRLTGDERLRRFADEWRYHAYWAKFETSASPADAHGVHAYSHTNAFSSAAMAFEVSGDPKYLAVIRNGYDYLQRHQCYATGGYGPAGWDGRSTRAPTPSRPRAGRGPDSSSPATSCSSPAKRATATGSSASSTTGWAPASRSRSTGATSITATTASAAG